MIDSPRLAWGLIGASDIAETRMIPAMRRIGHHIIAVASGNRTHGEAFATRNHLDTQTGTFAVESLLLNPAIDAVYISSVNDKHLEHAIAAAAAGKHVLCEKPLAVDVDSARQIATVCAQHGVVLGVNHHLPAAGTHRAIRKLVDDGAIGSVLSVNVQHTSLLPERLHRWRLSEAPGAGVVMDLSCHDASVINPLLGTRALQASAITARQGRWMTGAEDVAVSTLRYESDVLVRLHDSFTTPHTTTRLEVHGESGSIVAEGVMSPEPTGTVVLCDASGPRGIDVVDRRHTYDITLEAFALATRGRGRPVVDGVDAINALAVSLSILESARIGAVVPVTTWETSAPSP